MEKAPACPTFLDGLGSRCQDRDRIAMEQREASAALPARAAFGLSLGGRLVQDDSQRGEHQQPACGGLRPKNRRRQSIFVCRYGLSEGRDDEARGDASEGGNERGGAGSGSVEQSRALAQAERKEREATLRDKEMEIGAHKLKVGPEGQR